MATLVRLTALALTALALALTLEGPWRLAVTVGALVAGGAMAAEEIRSLGAALSASGLFSALDASLLLPLGKAVAAAQIARFAAALCRDGGQSALAALVETAGTLAALYSAVPLLRAFAAMLEDWL